MGSNFSSEQRPDDDARGDLRDDEEHEEHEDDVDDVDHVDDGSRMLCSLS